MGAEVVRAALGSAGLLILGAVAFVASNAAWGMYGKFAEAAAARAGAETQLHDLQSRDQKIQADVQTLSSDRGLEAAARERFGVVRPGEGEIRIVRQSTSTELLRQESGFWQRLQHFLFVW